MTPAEESKAITEGPRAVRVLLADHDPRVRYALRALLEAESGIQVVGEATTTDDLRRAVADTAPNVVLLDTLLPGSERVVSLVHALVRDGGRQVVAMSVRGGMRAAALEAGACAFVEKGALPDVVIGSLRAAVGHL